nr:immunoglobulin mu heavy chain [Bos taurus]
MNPLWTLLFVLSAPRGVLSQVQLRESGPSLVKPSQTLSLTCTVSGFSLSSNTVVWVRQAPGKTLEWIGGVWGGGNADYNAALKPRLSITKDNSKSQVSLSLTSVTLRTRPHTTVRNQVVKLVVVPGLRCSLQYDAWGQGLLVTVSYEGESHPRVF